MKAEGYSVGTLARRAAPLFGLVVFLLAGYAIHRVFREYHYHELRAAFQDITTAHIIAAACFAAGSYFMLTLFDVLGFRYAGVSLPYHRLALASFIGYSLSNNVGHSVLSGGAVRYRLYSAWGVEPGQIARIVTFCMVTGWVGFATMGGMACLLEPAGAFPALFPVHLHIPLGLALLGLSTAYLTVSALGWGVIRWHGHELALPGGRLALAQILAGAVDLTLTSAVFYSLLHLDKPLGFVSFAGFFMIAIIAGLVSQVPGGLGVFETIMLAFLSPYASGPHLISAIVLYRTVYYFVPLFLACALLGAHEILNRSAVLGRFAMVLRNLSPLIPSVFAISTMVGGAILLFSGATPPAHNRITLLQGLVPLPMVEFSHFLASLVGVLLLFLARALQRRVDAAYWLTSVLLAAGALLSLLKGLDYEEAVVLGVMLAALLPCHREFTRRSSLLAPRFGPGWVGAIAVIAASTVWLLFFAYRHVEYSTELWWQFTFSKSGAPSALRASVGAGVLLAGLSLAKLLQPAPVFSDSEAPPDMGRVAAAVAVSGSTGARLAFLGDKRFLFHDTLPGFIMYSLSGRCAVAMGDPVGDPEASRDLVWDFRDLCDRAGLMTVFYQVHPETLHLYADIGLSLAKFGEEAMVNLRTWSLDGAPNKNERNLLHRMDRDGVTFEVVERPAVPAFLDELRQVSDEWLVKKAGREKGFSLGFFDEIYLCQCRLALLRRGGQVVAFANLLESGTELSVDLMRHRADAPDGAMEALFLRLMAWGAQEGFERFNLGMAPLSGIEGGQGAPFWNRLASMVYEHGGRFYNFQGLRRYKDKFHPKWEPRYIASPGGISLPQVLASVAGLVNRGVGGTVMK